MNNLFKFLVPCSIILLLVQSNLSGQLTPSFNEKLDVVYANNNNVVKININQSDTFAIELKCNDASVTKMNDSTYSIRPYPVEGEIKLKLYYKKLPVEIANCEIKEIPAPILLFNGKEVSEISKNEVESFLRSHTLAFEEGVEPDYKSIYAYNYSIKTQDGRSQNGRIYPQNNYAKDIDAIKNRITSNSTITISNYQIMCEGNRVKSVKFEKVFKITE
jgi:hypothetical protein